jgi:hypothetical protein
MLSAGVMGENKGRFRSAEADRDGLFSLKGLVVIVLRCLLTCLKKEAFIGGISPVFNIQNGIFIPRRTSSDLECLLSQYPQIIVGYDGLCLLKYILCKMGS